MLKKAIVGDVHGDAGRLVSLLSKPELRERELIFTGDLVNRGPDSRGVLEKVAELVFDKKIARVLLGNHELLLLDFIDNGNFVGLAMGGGIATIKSYVGVAYGNVHQQFVEAFPREHLSLLRNANIYYEDGDVLVTHAGVSRADPSSRDVRDVVTGSHPELFAGDFDVGKLLVCGHYVQRVGLPFVSPHFVCVDTGCGTVGGPLTAFLLPERTFIQS